MIGKETVLSIFLFGLLVGCQSASSSLNSPSKPVSEGVSLPTSTVPLSEIDGLTGPIPSKTRREEFVRHFEKLVFELEDGTSVSRVRKWAGNIHFRIDSDKAIAPKLQSISRVLSQLTGVRITPKQRLTELDGVTFITRQGRWNNRHCYGIVYSRDVDKVIVGAEIFIGPDFPESALSECLEEELSQALGPMNDVLTIEDSLWRPKEQKTYHSLTWSDAVILRALYDERIKPGMHRDKALPLVRVIIGEILDELNR